MTFFMAKWMFSGISKIRLLFQACVCEESLETNSAHLKLSSWHVEAPLMCRLKQLKAMVD